MGFKTIEEHSFSIEMNSRKSVRSMAFHYMENGHILFEGFLGRLRNISLVEGVMLEIEGSNGILKLDITQQEIENFLLLRKTSSDGGEAK